MVVLLVLPHEICAGGLEITFEFSKNKIKGKIGNYLTKSHLCFPSVYGVQLLCFGLDGVLPHLISLTLQKK